MRRMTISRSRGASVLLRLRLYRPQTRKAFAAAGWVSKVREILRTEPRASMGLDNFALLVAGETTRKRTACQRKSPASAQTPATDSLAALARRPLSLAIVTRRKPEWIIREA